MEWYNLASGWGFNIPTSELDKIKEEYANDDVKCAKAAWSFWLKTHPAPSWACVAEALYRSFEHEVLKKLEMKYPIGMCCKMYLILVTVIISWGGVGSNCK